jgi:hypothetical protein
MNKAINIIVTCTSRQTQDPARGYRLRDLRETGTTRRSISLGSTREQKRLSDSKASAKATAAPQIKTITGDIRTCQLIEPLDRNWTPCFNGQNEQHAHPIRN